MGETKRVGKFAVFNFFRNQETLTAFRETELAKTIPTAYEARDVRREVYEVINTLRPEKGPFSD